MMLAAVGGGDVEPGRVDEHGRRRRGRGDRRDQRGAAGRHQVVPLARSHPAGGKFEGGPAIARLADKDDLVPRPVQARDVGAQVLADHGRERGDRDGTDPGFDVDETRIGLRESAAAGGTNVEVLADPTIDPVVTAGGDRISDADRAGQDADRKCRRLPLVLVNDRVGSGQ